MLPSPFFELLSSVVWKSVVGSMEENFPFLVKQDISFKLPLNISVNGAEEGFTFRNEAFGEKLAQSKLTGHQVQLVGSHP